MAIWRYSDENMRLEIDLAGIVTILTGDSGSGKTYFVKRIRRQLKEKALWEFTESTISLDKIKVCECLEDTDKVLNCEGNLIIFDRFDMYANEQLLKFINTNKNMVLLISRRGYKEIRITQKQLIKLESNYKDGICYIKSKTVL